METYRSPINKQQMISSTSIQVEQSKTTVVSRNNSNNIAAINRAPYLPSAWENDVEMSGLMSVLKARHTNPTHYDRVMEFWKQLIAEYCRHEKSCVFSLDELKLKFRRGAQIPSPLATVIAELEHSGTVMTKGAYERKNQGWLAWGMSWISPSGWFSAAGDDLSHVQIVHMPILKQKARELLDFYRVKYNTALADCPEVIAFDDLREETTHIISRESFPLVISELVSMGEVSVGRSRDGEQILKFKDLTEIGPARFTEADANVHELRRAMNRLDMDIKKAEQKEQLLKSEALSAMRKKDKKGALNIMRKVAMIRKQIKDKDGQYNQMLGMLEQLAQTKQTKEIVDAYKAGSKAFKETLARQGITAENVDVTVDSVRDMIDDYNEIDEALRCGFSAIAQSDTVDEAELEAELSELLEGDRAEREREPSLKFPEIPSSAVRVGKRVLDLQYDLPEVPKSSGNQASSASRVAQQVNGGGGNGGGNGRGTTPTTASLEERWKRLRMENHLQ